MAEIEHFQWQAASGVASLPDLDFPLLEAWLSAVADSYGRIPGILCYRFVDDQEILRVNRQFLGHDYFTDIITFDYCRGRLLRGDMVISLETVASNALALNVPYHRELLRVIVHGLLHLCGINDKGPGERELMEAAENRALALLDNLTSQTK